MFHSTQLDDLHMQPAHPSVAPGHPAPLVRRSNLVETVQNSIIEAIRRGEFKVGDYLPTEQALSVMYGVSRPTVREAMARLRSRGSFLSRSGHRTRIDEHPDARTTELAFDDISCIEDFKRCYEFRRNIEAGAARHAALNRDEDDLEAIWGAFRRLHGYSEADEMPVDADFAFHTAVAAASKNPLFLTVLESIRSQALFTMDLSRKFSRPQQPQRMDAVEEEHRRVAEAIAEGNADAAEAAMRLHIDRSTERVLGS
jgi:DNA-binding FadR family transcriptional regulator